MSNNELNRDARKSLKPLLRDADQPTFDEQWQAQALAMADLLIQSGRLDTNAWSQALGKHVNALQVGDKDNMQSYYQAVLNALEELIQHQEILSEDQIESRQQAWKDAYLSTPHGQPVELSK